MKKQNIAIIAVVAFVLAVAVGYALFSETLQINGTATAKGSFDVQFTNVGVIEKKGYTPSDGHSDEEIAKINEGNKTLTITIDKLDYPGAYVNIPVTVTNKGTIPAKLKDIKQTNLTGDEGPIKVTYTGIATTDDPIDPEQSKEMNIRVEWLKDINETAEAKTFTITLNYEQATD